MEMKELKDCLTGKPTASTSIHHQTIVGYIIRELLGHLYITTTTVIINKWRSIEFEGDGYWIISEHVDPILSTRFIVYKSREKCNEIKETHEKTRH